LGVKFRAAGFLRSRLLGLSCSHVPILVQFFEQLVGFSVCQAFDSVVVHVAEAGDAQHRFSLLGHFQVLIDASSEYLDLRTRHIDLHLGVLELVLKLNVVLLHNFLQLHNIVLINLHHVVMVFLNFYALLLDLSFFELEFFDDVLVLALVARVEPGEFVHLLLEGFQVHFELANLHFLLLIQLVPQHHLFVLLSHH